MRRFTARFSIALVSFIIGVTATTCWPGLIHQQPAAMTVRSEPPTTIPSVVEEPLTFIPTFRGCKPGWVQGYDASDGEKLSEWSYPYDSPEQAQRELYKSLTDAIEVKRHSVSWDEAGNSSVRAIAVFQRHEYRDQERIDILWTEGRALRGINAATLRHALEFEKASIARNRLD